MRISHVSCGVDDLDEVEQRLRDVLGLGLWRFPRDLGAHLPLGARQYVELHTGAHPLWRRGWLSWAVAVDDLDAWIRVAALDDARDFGGDPERTFTPWRGRLAGTSRSRASGGTIPYLIEYDGAVDLEAVFLEKHRVARHDVTIGPIRRILGDGRRITEVVVEVAGVERTLPLP